MVGLRLSLKQLAAADLAGGEVLADPSLLGVAESRGHRAGGDEQGGQLAEGQGADQHTGGDLVAYAQQEDGVEELVGQGYRGGHGDDLAGQERELHPAAPLGHAVAHGRYASGHLCHAAGLSYCLAQDGGIGLERLVGGQDVVVGRDDGDVGRGRVRHEQLVLGGARCHAVGEVGAAQS